MRSRTSSGRALAALLLLSATAAGCGGTAGTAGSAYKDPHPLPLDTMTVVVAELGTHGGRFVMAQTNPPRTFNAIMANETSSTDLTDGRLFIGLSEFHRATQVAYPMLAKSWETSPDGRVWTWHLRRGAAFSDGHPITAEDVLFSFAVAMDTTLHPSILDLLKVDGQPFEMSATDSYTVIMKVAAPYALAISVAGSVPIMPKHVLESSYRSGNFASAYNISTKPDSVVTSGPWRVKEYVPGEKTVLSRNPYWFGVDSKGQRMPYLDELVFVIVPDQNTAALKFRAGEIDAIDNVKPEDYKSYADNQQQGDYTLYDLGPAMTTNFFWFNLNKVRDAKSGKKLGSTYVEPTKYAWFNNPTFRRAVSMAVDREAMIKSVFFGDGVKNWSTSTAGNKTWYTPEATHFDYAPEEAKKLLASLGWKDKDGDGFLEDTQGHTIGFAIKTNGDNNVRVGMCNFIKDDLAKVGIKVTPTPVDFNTLITNVRQDFQYESVLLGLQTGVPPDPGMGQNVWRSSGLTHYWNIKQPRPETPAEARIDQLMTANVGTTDMNERKRTWTDIQNTVNDQGFIVWLPTLIVKVPVRNRFGNLHPTVIPHRIIWNIDQVYVKPRGQRA